jgi:hypothetical protein
VKIIDGVVEYNDEEYLDLENEIAVPCGVVIGALVYLLDRKVFFRRSASESRKKSIISHSSFDSDIREVRARPCSGKGTNPT